MNSKTLTILMGLFFIFSFGLVFEMLTAVSESQNALHAEYQPRRIPRGDKYKRARYRFAVIESVNINTAA